MVSGFRNGLGFNPWPTFDWNIMLTDPLIVPAFTTFNTVGGMLLFGFVIIGIYWTNTWATGYLPILSNRVFDHYGKLYNVSLALDSKGMYDYASYMDFSAAYMVLRTALCGAFFGVYSSTITYVFLFHRYEIGLGFKNLWNSMRKKKRAEDQNANSVQSGEYTDVHNRLMSAYKEGEFQSLPEIKRMEWELIYDSSRMVAPNDIDFRGGFWLWGCFWVANIYNPG